MLSLAVSGKADYSCLVLPSGIKRPKVMGEQDMSQATDSLLRMCGPLLELIQNTKRLKGGATVWYK